MTIKDSFENVGFTPEEKMDLTARLERAAEQEDNMTNAAKRKIKRISGGMIFGIAAAVVMTAGALAAVLSPGLRDWMDATAPGASQALEDSIYRIGRSETYEGWTVTLDECVGDDTRAYIMASVTALEGVILERSEDKQITYDVEQVSDGESVPSYGEIHGTSCEIPDGNPADNKLSFFLELYDKPDQGLRGQRIGISIGRFRYHGLEDSSAEQPPLIDHMFLFEDIALDYPDTKLRLEPNVECPSWMGPPF